MEDPSPFAYVLHIERVNGCNRYHFITDTYHTEPVKTLLGLSVTIHGKAYVVPLSSFAMSGNELFTPPLTLWLCKHYLHVKPTPLSIVTTIDTLVQVTTSCTHKFT